jgi:peptidase A4-like protein
MNSPGLSRHGVRIAALALMALSFGALAGPAGAASVSGNWAGYVATPHAGGSRFSSVSGTWRQPAVSCSPGRASYSAVWVGLGGYGEGASSLEQIGTDANCSAGGRPSYASWFELLPADPVPIRLKVSPGDLISASVTTKGTRVTLRMRDLTTGARFSSTRHYSHPDASTAEWIVEAPSSCSSASVCTTLPLAHFASVPFSSATATAHGQTRTLLDPGWSASALELRQGSGDLAGPGAADVHAVGSVVRATPSAVSSSGSFSVGWVQSSASGEPSSAPTLPGFGGAP